MVNWARGSDRVSGDTDSSRSRHVRTGFVRAWHLGAVPALCQRFKRRGEVSTASQRPVSWAHRSTVRRASYLWMTLEPAVEPLRTWPPYVAKRERPSHG